MSECGQQDVVVGLSREETSSSKSRNDVWAIARLANLLWLRVSLQQHGPCAGWWGSTWSPEGLSRTRWFFQCQCEPIQRCNMKIEKNHKIVQKTWSRMWIKSFLPRGGSFQDVYDVKLCFIIGDRWLWGARFDQRFGVGFCFNLRKVILWHIFTSEYAGTRAGLGSCKVTSFHLTKNDIHGEIVSSTIITARIIS